MPIRAGSNRPCQGLVQPPGQAGPVLVPLKAVGDQDRTCVANPRRGQGRGQHVVIGHGVLASSLGGILVWNRDYIEAELSLLFFGLVQTGARFTRSAPLDDPSPVFRGHPASKNQTTERLCWEVWTPTPPVRSRLTILHSHSYSQSGALVRSPSAPLAVNPSHGSSRFTQGRSLPYLRQCPRISDWISSFSVSGG